MTKGKTLALIQLDTSTPIKMNEYYLGLLSGFNRYLAIMPTIITKSTFDTAETKEAPICIKLA